MITIRRNVLFPVGIYHEQFQSDQIQNCRPAATFDFNVCSYHYWTKCALPGRDFPWKTSTWSNSKLLLNKRCGFREGNVIFNSIKLKMADMRQLLTSKCVIPFQIARPLIYNKMCEFRGGGWGMPFRNSTQENFKWPTCDHRRLRHV